MGTTFPIVDAGLSLAWMLVSLAVLLCWRAEWTQESKRTLVAILCVLVLLFPAISMADDIAELTMTYDPSPSPLTLTGAHESKHIIVPALLACHCGQTHGQPLADTGENPVSESPSGGVFLLLSSSCGIHSPPQS